VQLLADAAAFSATDLNNFLACEHLTALDLAALRGGTPRPTERPRQAELLAELGEEHERRYRAKLIDDDGLDVVTIERGTGYEDAAAATEAAMALGVPVIYQATFYDGSWLGHADFLRRVDAPERGGRWPWHYEVEDTKLARHTEPYFLLQLCYYSEHVARIQGVSPQRMYVVLGDGTHHEFRVDEFSAYYRSVKARFLERIHAENVATYPLPVPNCSFCVWNPACEGRRAADDHLSGVAGMTRLQTARLGTGGITTLRELALAPGERVPAEMAAETFEKLRRQARLQFDQREAIRRSEPDPGRYELLAEGAAAGRGFGLLPEPSAGDIFFDMEGDPYYDIGTGLEYLFGVFTADDDYVAFWGCDRSILPLNDRLAEKRAFENFIDFVVERRRRFPDLHVYHYAPYEKTALQKLAQRHATRESEVDLLLREEVLVDLYRIVRQAVVVGQPSYSLKKIEEYYGKRGGASGIAGGGDSILAFEDWLSIRGGARRDDVELDKLQQYNEDDCISTQGLRDWLLKLRGDAMRSFETEFGWYAGKPPAEPGDDPDALADLKRRLDDALPQDEDPAAFEGDPRVWPLFLARHMLEYHWREDKPVHWQFHDRCASYADDPKSLTDDAEAIVGLEFVRGPWAVRRSQGYELTFPPQLHKIDGGDCYDALTKLRTGTVEWIEDGDGFGLLHLVRHGALNVAPLPSAITMKGIVPAGAVRAALARFAETVLAGNAPARYAAAYDVLVARAPRVRGRPALTVLQPDSPDEASLAELVAQLDQSYLFIQGPPGAGKTYIGARLIVDQLALGRRVGITANSHKAIHNLLDAIEPVARARGVPVTGIKKCTRNERATYYDTATVSSSSDAFDLERANLFAGTAWAFGPPAMDQQLDVLFIDEAGQMALPVAIAAMTAAKNTVLLGDPQQLAQVSHTRHPGNVGASVLAHLLGAKQTTIAPERGVLLTDSWRMHPDVCRFVSETMYEGRLHSAPGRERQAVRSRGLSGTGLRCIPVTHALNTQRSEEEALVIADAIDQLLAGTVTGFDGATRPLTAADIMVVSPYNAQVTCIRRRLVRRGGETARVDVGTVDKFQGREAFVVLFSTAASAPDAAPRGARFIFDRQRFNVAVSRARALAVLVCSPALLELGCSSIDDVRIANGVCRFVELAARYP
jgi:uncharacterized protein